MNEVADEFPWRAIQEQVTAALDAADALVLTAQDMSLEDVAEGLVVLWRAKRDLSEVYRTLESKLADLMDEMPEMDLAAAKIEKRLSTPRKTWEHKGLGQEVAARLVQLSVDMETGEVLKDPTTLMIEMLDYAAPSYWRVKALEKIGIDPDDYCEVGEPKPSISIRLND